MKITKISNANGVAKFFLDGRLDTSTAPTLEIEMNKVLEDCKELYLDIKNLEYVSSAGLRVLLTIHKNISAKQGKFVISHPNDVVKDIFDMTGFSSILKIE